MGFRGDASFISREFSKSAGDVALLDPDASAEKESDGSVVVDEVLDTPVLSNLARTDSFI